MKKKLLTLFLVTATLCSQAGGISKIWSFGSKTAQARKYTSYSAFAASPKKVTAQLERRAKRTYQQAYNLENKLHQTIPVSRFISSQAGRFTYPPLDIVLFQREMYPELNAILNTDEQFTQYFVARNNRQTLKYFPQEVQTLLTKQQSVDHLKSTQIIPSHPVQEDMQWLAAQIPLDTDYLLLGEFHDIPEIYKSLTALTPYLRSRFGQRPIIWLTEFLSSNRWDNCDFTDMQDFVRLCSRSKLQNIPFQGLEPSFVYNSHHWQVPSISCGLNQDKMCIWQSREGVRLRNESWKAEIAKVRQQNPEALIIIHAGFDHLDYTATYSIGAYLQQQGAQTFNIAVMPGFGPYATTPLLNFLKEHMPQLSPKPAPEDGFLPVSFFDLATGGEFPQRILRFAPQDSAITGFDIQIKVPAKPATLFLKNRQ